MKQTESHVKTERYTVLATKKYANELAGDALVRMTGKKFCSSCQLYKAVDTGAMVDTAAKKFKRWKCASCLNRISERQYQSRKEESNEQKN